MSMPVTPATPAKPAVRSPLALWCAAMTAMLATPCVMAQPAPARAGTRDASPSVPRPLTPSPVAGISYDAAFFPSDKDGSMAHAVPNPDTVLGFRLGDKPATHAQIEAVVKSIAANSPRTKLVPYAVTHEGRTLYYLVISSEENIRNLDKILEDRALFADPRKADAATGDRLAATLPAVAWMAYSIHGDEMSGADASLAYAYHLAATSDADTVKMLSEVIVVIDPLMNPDGRDRCLAAVRENRTSQPNLDDQSVIHSGVWPSGRMNHYLFDLNRDWIFATQPESRGRILAASRFEPQLFMESHEMGSQDTFLFSPPREAINANIPGNVRKWWEVFAKDQAASFDTRGWRYYTGEWNDEWYPGYTGSWGNHRNAIGILYEQAAIVSDGVRRPEGTIETYREAVHHQLVSSVANVTTLWRNREQVMKDFLAERRAAVGAEGPYASRTFAIVPGANAERTRRFLDLMHVEGFEVHQAGSAFRAAGKDRLGRAVADREFPAGTLLVANRQPLAHQVAVMLEFDPRPSKEFLTDERRELLRFGRSKMYDVTGWSIPMLLDLDAYELSVALPAGAKLVETPNAGASAVPTATGAGSGKPPPVEAAAALLSAPVGYAINGADDRAVSIAGRLMERGVRVRASDKPTTLADVPFPRGSLFVLRKDNGLYEGDLGATLNAVVSEVAPDAAPAPVPGPAAAPRSGLTPVPITTGMGPGDLPDLGGEHFSLLSLPRIAVLGREPFSAYSYGEIWHLIDHTLGLRATYLDASSLGGVDLRRYNVIIAPSGGGSALKESMASLKAWCEGGGTLIAIGSSAATIATESSGMSAVRLLPDVLTKLDDQRQQVVREWEARRVEVDPDAAFAFAPPKEVVYPWQLGDEGDKPSDDEAKRRDAWRSLFMPQGAVLATRVDDRSWLTSGCADELPVMYDTDVVLVCGSAAEAPLRVGVYSPLPPGASEDAKPAPARSDKDSTGDAGAARPETPTDSGQTKGKTERVTDGADRNAKKADGPQGDAGAKDSPKKEEPKAPGKDDDTSGKGDKDDADDDKDKDDKDKKPAPGWMLAPPGYELRVRMSGLLWPEAADRIAHSAWLTREQVGRGQVILFASSPTFRAATLGTSRVLSNAIVYGPGMGASEPIRP